MRGGTHGGDITDRGSGGQGGDIQSTKAKGTHKERKAQREIRSLKFKGKCLPVVCLVECKAAIS